MLACVHRGWHGLLLTALCTLPGLERFSVAKSTRWVAQDTDYFSSVPAQKSNKMEWWSMAWLWPTFNTPPQPVKYPECTVQLVCNCGLTFAACSCGTQVDASGPHAFICKRAPGRIARHQALNDVVAREFVSAGVTVTKEPIWLTRQDGKQPDGLTLIAWQRGRPLTWDITIAHTLAGSYVSMVARSGGAAAAQAACRKSAKYDLLVQTVSTHCGRNSRPSERIINRVLFQAGPKDRIGLRRQSGARLSFSVDFSHCTVLQLCLFAQQLSQRRQRVTTLASVFNFCF